MRKLNVAIIGYGRSGCDIHGAFLRSPANDICTVVAVVENDPARAAVAREHFGCDTYRSYKDLFERSDLDFVVDASYSDLHYPITKDLLAHGLNVLCEKPLCKTPEMVQDLIDTAKANNVIFTIFHQYRFNDYYIKMHELLQQKVIGDIKLVRACQNSFSRRYDWQTLLYRDAGSMRNNAAHSIEQIMHLAGSDEMPKIQSKMDIWNSVGDAEDYLFCTLEYSDGVRYEMEVNPSDAFAQDAATFTIYGSRGTMRVYIDKIVYRYYLDEEVPVPVLQHKSIHHPDGSPAYCNNQLVWHEESLEFDEDIWSSFATCSNRFYHNWYDALVNGAELFIKPEHIKAQIAIFCEIERQNPLEVKFKKPDDVI
ncbi:MAG: Gfo/Idh/MocA family oxidoreductase [Bacillota bacterium]|nr:Gfo/Idh/MocA family oxidoreductase [Bacillota bacterium]